MYNKTVYESLGLEVPTTWDEFIANSEKIKAEGGGIAPILQSYGDTWTSQLFVLGDFANVTAQDPEWAEQYTANDPNAKYVDEPAFAGFANQQEAFDKGLFNEDFPSMTNAQAMDALATGAGAQYPMLSATIATIIQNNPDNVDDIGVFALPAADAADTAITIWQPNAIYISKATEGDKLDAAKKFVAFANSDEGCEVQNTTAAPAGPYVTTACTLPDDVPALVADIQAYFDSGEDRVRARVPLPDQGTEPREHHRRGRLGHHLRGGGRRTVRRRCEEAGPAARTRGLVNHPTDLLRSTHQGPAVRVRRRPRFTKE